MDVLLDAVISAAAKAVVGKMFDAGFSFITSKTRKDDQPEPAELAFQLALTKSYLAFRRRYPEIASELFTEPFLTHEAAPMLADLTADKEVNAVEFASLWVNTERHHIHDGELKRDGKPTAAAVEASAYFLHLLRAEVRHSPYFHQTFDSTALDELPKIARLLGDMQSNLDKLGKEIHAPAINTGGGAHIAGDANVSGDFVNRDKIINQYFMRGPINLQSYYTRPDAIFDRVDVKNFIGREKLLEEINTFVNDPEKSKGLLLIEGQAGLGKTALMAHLVYQNGYFHVFGDSFNGVEKIIEAKAHLAAQIVSRFQLEEFATHNLLDEASLPRFLQRVLEAAADKLSAGERIVVIYDALDQSCQPTERDNPLGMPQSLPKGVFVVASQRPVQEPPKCDAPRTAKLITALDPDNLDDIKKFLESKIKNSAALRGRLGAYSPSEFVRILAERASGNWMYLHFVLQEMADGKRGDPLKLDNLPHGLNDYYCQYWLKYQNEDVTKWRELYAPVLGILGAIDEPITLEQLAMWAGIPHRKQELNTLLVKTWRAYMLDSGAGAGRKFQFVHRSLTRFMRGEPDDSLATAQQEFLLEMQEITAQGHRNIVEWHRQKCGGNWPALAADGYARHNLIRHMNEAAPEEMFDLVANSPAWAKARDAADESYANYLVDVQTAWAHADKKEWAGMGQQLRCALIKSSLHSLSSNVFAELMEGLVKNRLWSQSKALGYIRQNSQDDKKAEAISRIAPLLSNAAFLSDAFDLARDLDDENTRAHALADLAPHLPPDLLAEALSAACAIKEENTRAFALAGLAPHLPPDLLAEALSAAHAINDEYARARILVNLAPHFSPDLCPQVVSEGLSAARAINDEDARARALAGLAPHLPPDLLAEALSAARAINNEYTRADALAGLAPHLPPDLLAEALSAARAINNEGARAHALAGLTPHLPSDLRPQALSEALSAARAINDEDARVRTLAGLTPHLPPDLLAEALSAAHAINNEYTRTVALTGLAPYLPPDLLAEALSAARAINNEGVRAYALAGLAPHLPPDLLSEALSAARAINNEGARARALAGLTPHLPSDLRPQALSEALSAARAINDEDARVRTLAGLTPHLPPDLLAEALSAARAINNEYTRADVLAGLAPYLPPDLLAEALSAARAINSEYTRADALAGLAPYLPPDLLAEALSAARAINSEYTRADALAGLAPHLPPDLLSEALSAACAINDEYARARAFAGLAPHLPPDLLSKALTVARAINKEYARAHALAGLAPHLDAQNQLSLLPGAFIFLIQNKSVPFGANLSDVCEAWKKLGYKDFSFALWQKSLNHLSKEERADFLKILPKLSAPIEDFGKDNALQELAKAILDVGAWWP